MRHAAGLAPVLLLAACVSSGPDRPLPAPGLTLVPAVRGLGVQPTGQEIGFGRFRPGAEAAVARILGRPGTPAACATPGLSATSWEREGLVMVFDAEGAFVGWQAGGGRVYRDEIRAAGASCTAVRSG